jgi:hypothetical protein
VGRQFIRAARRAAAAGICWVLVPLPAPGADLRPVSVLLYDEANTSAVVLNRARAVTARILAAAGLTLDWLDEPAARSRRLQATDEAALREWLSTVHSVRLIRTTPSGDLSPDASALGVSVPGARLAMVLYGRVEQRAREGGVDAGTVLGHVIAHELGHLLLRRASHSATGLMRAELDTSLAAQGRLLFTDDEARTLRALAERGAPR